MAEGRGIGPRVVWRWSAVGILALGLAALGATEARAGDMEARPGTHSITVGGDMEFHGTFRNRDLLNVNNVSPGVGLGNRARRARVGGLADRNESAFYVFPTVGLALHAKLAQQVYGHIRMQTAPHGFYDANPGFSDDLGTAFRHVGVETASVTLDEFLLPSRALSVTVGVQPFALDLRGDGNAFLVDVRQSEDAWRGAALNDTGGAAVGVGGVTGGTSAFGSRNGTGNAADGTGPGSTTGLAGSQEAGGVLVRYGVETMEAQGFFFTVSESRDQGNDTELYGGNLDLKMGDRGTVRGVLAMFRRDTAQIYNLGGGADLYLMRADAGLFEIFGEGYAQRGDFLRNAADLGGRDVRQSSWAFNSGARYGIEGSSLKPWVEGGYTYVLGDVNPNDNSNRDFVSYEDNDLSLIVEENDYGLDVDSNYQAMRGIAGFRWDWVADDAIPDDVGARVSYHYFELARNGGGVRKIGDEIDARLDWMYSENLTVGFAAGWLFDIESLAGFNRELHTSQVFVKLDF